MKINRQTNLTKAMTLAELVVAIGVGSIVVAAVGLMMLFGSRSFVALANYLEMNQASRLALDHISVDVRHARELISFEKDPPELVFWQELNEDGADEATGQVLTYRYVPDESALYCIYTPTNGSPEVKKKILTECDSFEFGLYQNNPKAGNPPSQWDTTSIPKQTRLVELKWLCTRKILGRKVNTESIQTAKIVLRN